MVNELMGCNIIKRPGHGPPTAGMGFAHEAQGAPVPPAGRT